MKKYDLDFWIKVLQWMKALINHNIGKQIHNSLLTFWFIVNTGWSNVNDINWTVIYQPTQNISSQPQKMTKMKEKKTFQI